MNDTNTFNSWDEMSDLAQATETWWDAYKDAYGFRPRSISTEGWSLATFVGEIEELSKMIGRNEQERVMREREAVEIFERQIEELQAAGAHDRAWALRWIHEAEGSNGDNDFLCYLLGLPYKYLTTKKEA